MTFVDTAARLKTVIGRLEQTQKEIANDEYMDYDIPVLEDLITKINIIADEMVRIYCAVPVDGTEGCYPPEDRI